MKKYNETKSMLPPQDVFVDTMINDEHSERNHLRLKRINNLWFTIDGMYVYYTPTHWKYCDENSIINKEDLWYNK